MIGEAKNESSSTAKLAGRWQDMVLYWAWRGHGVPDSDPPTVKRIEYAKIHYQNWKPEPMTTNLAVTVFDDEVPKEVHREELEWHRQRGAEITMPPNDGDKRPVRLIGGVRPSVTN